MSFQPVVPAGGILGWGYLNATMASQRQAFDSGRQITSDTAYFETKIAEISTAEELVADRRLMRVALGAFGLQDDIDSRFLIRKVLEGGTAEPRALANRLSDARYKELANAFGFAGPGAPGTRAKGFGAKIAAQYRDRAFEVAVGESDQSLRLAMNADRELSDLAAQDKGSDAGWFRILGTPPLRQVFETALGLPKGFAQLDIDRQLAVFKERATSRLGFETISDLADADKRNAVIRRFLLQEQIGNIAVQSPGAIALTLLQAR